MSLAVVIGAVAFVLVFVVRTAFKLGLALGRMEGHPRSMVPALENVKFMADSNLLQFIANSEFNLFLGDKVVKCKSPTETAQFSQAISELLNWFTPVKEHPPSAN